MNHSSLYMICPQWPTCVWSSNCVQSSEIQPSDDRDDVTTISGAGKQKLSIFQTSEPHLLWQPSTLTYCHKEIELCSSSWHTFVLQCIHQIHQIHCLKGTGWLVYWYAWLACARDIFPKERTVKLWRRSIKSNSHLGESVTQTQRLKIRYFWNFTFCHLNIVRV